MVRDAGNQYSSSRTGDGDFARGGGTDCPVECADGADDIKQTATVPHLRHMQLELSKSNGILVRAACVSSGRPEETLRALRDFDRPQQRVEMAVCVMFAQRHGTDAHR